MWAWTVNVSASVTLTLVSRCSLALLLHPSSSSLPSLFGPEVALFFSWFSAFPCAHIHIPFPCTHTSCLYPPCICVFWKGQTPVFRMEKSNRAATCTSSAPWRTLLQKFISFYFSLRRVCLDAQVSSVHPDGHVRTGLSCLSCCQSVSQGTGLVRKIRTRAWSRSLMWTGPEVLEAGSDRNPFRSVASAVSGVHCLDEISWFWSHRCRNRPVETSEGWKCLPWQHYPSQHHTGKHPGVDTANICKALVYWCCYYTSSALEGAWRVWSHPSTLERLEKLWTFTLFACNSFSVYNKSCSNLL